jgi:hypothetical protein
MVFGEADQRASALKPDVLSGGLRRLAEFRHRIRQFLHSSEEIARTKGIEPPAASTAPGPQRFAQGCPPQRHRASRERGALSRRHGNDDHCEVLVKLTSHSEALLHRLSVLHWEELRVSGPALSESLWAVMNHSNRHEGKMS